jgi:hypothetical protein
MVIFRFESDRNSFCLDSDDEDLIADMPNVERDLVVGKEVHNSKIMSIIYYDR